MFNWSESCSFYPVLIEDDLLEYQSKVLVHSHLIRYIFIRINYIYLKFWLIVIHLKNNMKIVNKLLSTSCFIWGL